MPNPFFDPKLQKQSREIILSMLKLYFEFAERMEATMPPEVVAVINGILIEVEDENVSDDRLVMLYRGAIKDMEAAGNLRAFILLPTLFMKDDTGLPYGTPDVQ